MTIESLLHLFSIISIAALYYIYDGYLRTLKLLVWLNNDKPKLKPQVEEQLHLPTITILLTVYNEQSTIVQRINNLLECDYPADKLEIIVASDGSTDATEQLVKQFEHSNVKLFRAQNRLGKSDTQNQAIQVVANEIIVFTDAGSEFDRQFLMAVVQDFAIPSVGAITSHLLFKNKKNGVSSSQNFYWRYEVALKQHENHLGMLAVMSGAGLAVRRVLLEKLYSDSGEDCTIPLSVISQGYRVNYATQAIVYDVMPDQPSTELKNRIRMTQRNWSGTWRYPNLLNPFKHLKYAFALWSHKLLRWLSPVFILTLTITSMLGSIMYASYFYFLLTGIGSLYLLGGIGWMTNYYKFKFRVTDIVFSFLLANVGFLFGIIKHFSGKKNIRYK